MIRIECTHILGCLLLLFFSWTSQAQSKLSVTIQNPTVVHLCITSEDVKIELRNITTSSVSGVETEVTLPAGITYAAGSVSGVGVFEKNITNLSKPVFRVSDVGVAQARTLYIKLNTSCNLSSFLNNGGLALLKTTTLYSGGSVQKNGGVLNIKQPAVVIQNITNQLKTADLGEIYERKITVKNSGSGKLKSIVFNRVYNSGHQILSFNGRNIVKNGNSIEVILDSTDFKTIGNKDNFFDYNESFDFMDSVQVVACSQLNVIYYASWGCNTATCKTTQKSANTTITAKKPDLVITPSSSTLSCLSDSYVYDQHLVIYNKGNDTARTIDFSVFQSAGTGYYPYAISKILTSTFTYKKAWKDTGKYIKPYQTKSTSYSGVYSCLGLDAQGMADLLLPDLAPGDSLILQWQSQSCCPTVCNSGTLYNQRWKYSATYQNQCNTKINVNERYGSVGSVQSFSVSKLIPTDIVDGQTQQLEFTVNNGYFFYQSSRSQLTLFLKIPKAITHSLSSADIQFTHANGSSWLPNRIFQSNDTVFAIFDGTPKVTLPRSELLINIKGDCQKNTSNASETIGLDIVYNPDTTCTSGCAIPVYCTSDKIKIHCATSCASGLHFNGFEARRITFGLPDNDNDGLPDNTGSLDSSKIKHNRIMYGDTLLTTFRGKVNNAGSITNWSYGKATTTLDYGRYLSAKEAALTIYRNGLKVITCTQVPFTYTATGNSKTYTFDVSVGSLSSAGCLLYPTFRYANTDSLVLEVKYVVDQNLRSSVDLQLNNTFYLSSVSSPNASQKFYCDDFSARLSLLGYYFTNYGANNYYQDGCNNFNIYQNFYLSVGRCCTNYGGGNIFPYEYRRWAKLREIIVQKPAGFDITNGSFRQYRTKGTGATANQWISQLLPYSQTQSEIKYMTDSLYEDLGGSIYISDDGFHGTYTGSLTPNCKAKNGVNNLVYGFVFEKLGYLGTGLDTIFSGNSSDIITYTRPNLNIVITDDYVYPEKDTIEWEIRVENNSNSAQAKNLWIGALSNPKRELVAVLDKKSNTFLSQNKNVFKIGDIPARSFKDLVVYAIYNSCDKDSIELQLGNDCSSYPDSIGAYSCDNSTYILKYEPINTRLDASILTQLADIDLCKQQEYSIRINNTGTPKVYAPYLDIQLQPGMTIKDTAWVFIDGRKDSIMIPSYMDLGASVIRWDFSKKDSLFDANGLNGVNSAKGYKLEFKFWFTTDCNYTSGSFFLMRPGGYLKCGKAVNAPYLISDDINIKGVVKPYFSAISLDFNPLVPCNYDEHVYAKFINLGPDTTGYTDRFVLNLPPGILVDTNFIDTNYNAPNQKPTLDNTSGRNMYTWVIPSDIIPGDSAVFTIKTILNNYDLSCGTKQIYAQAIVKSRAYCVDGNTYCDINVATSSLQKTDSVIKGAFKIDFLNAKSVPVGSEEMVTMNYSITNNGIEKLTNSNLICQIVYDANQNGTIDTNDRIVAFDTIRSAIESDSTLARMFNFRVSSDYTCDLLLYISDSNCVCNSSLASISNIQLLNAGRDTLVCANEQVYIGFEGNKNNTYQWNNSHLLNRSDTSMAKLITRNTLPVRDTMQMVLTTDKGACFSQDTVIISVYAGMEIDMPDTAVICQGERVSLGYLVKGGESKLKNTSWSPSDSLSNVRGYFTYANPTINTCYTLTVSDLMGCVVKDSTLVKVVDKPSPDFDLTDGCEKQLFSIKNKTNYKNGLKGDVLWDFGKLGQSSFDNPVILIDSAQQINVRLYAENKQGCWDTLSKTLNVYPLPKPKLSYSDSCEEYQTQFFANSTIDVGKISHQWNIDGAILATDTVLYTLPSKDSIQVKLVASSDFGCKDSILQSIRLQDKPAIDLLFNDQCFNSLVSLVPSQLSGTRDSITEYKWDLGDKTTYNQKTVLHQYADTGSYLIRLEVVNAANCSDTIKKYIQVHPLPKSQFDVSDICLNDSIKVRSNATIDQGLIQSIFWDINGSGFLLGDTIFSIHATQLGKQWIRQKVVSDRGCVDSSENNFTTFYNEIARHLQQGLCENENIQFRTNYTRPDSVIQTIWIMNTDTLIGENVSFPRYPAGDYTLTQQLETNRGCVHDSSFTISIKPIPLVDIVQNKACDDNVVDFSTRYTNQTYEWNLSTSTQNFNQAFSNTFSQLGKYTVSLKVTNDYGCSTSIIDSGVIEHIVKPDFKIEDICENDYQWIYQISNGNKSPISAAIFELGDGNQVNALDSFLYAYSSPGTYPVKLTITTTPGCNYSTTQSIIVHPLPVAGFSLYPETADIFSSEIEGIDESSGADSIVYFISDGNTYYTTNFKHNLPDSGFYTIQQWVSSPFGCMDSISKKIYISHAYDLFIPNAFTPTNDGLNEGFRPIGIGVKSYEMAIYNRWGGKVFQSKDKFPVWDGKDAIPGYYMYQIKALDFRNNIHYYSGTVYLIQ